MSTWTSAASWNWSHDDVANYLFVDPVADRRYFAGYPPARCRQSGLFTPAAETSIRTSAEAGLGVALSQG